MKAHNLTNMYYIQARFDYRVLIYKDQYIIGVNAHLKVDVTPD